MGRKSRRGGGGERGVAGRPMLGRPAHFYGQNGGAGEDMVASPSAFCCINSQNILVGFISVVQTSLSRSEKVICVLIETCNFQHMRTQATGPLATFLDYITYSYMIDNIILLITGTLHQVGSLALFCQKKHKM